VLAVPPLQTPCLATDSGLRVVLHACRTFSDRVNVRVRVRVRVNVRVRVRIGVRVRVRVRVS
jgi:hypothetical protein